MILDGDKLIPVPVQELPKSCCPFLLTANATCPLPMISALVKTANIPKAIETL